MQNKYPLNTFSEETRKEIVALIESAVAEERMRIVKWASENTGAGGDTPYCELICYIAQEEDIDVAIKKLSAEELK